MRESMVQKMLYSHTRRWTSTEVTSEEYVMW